MNVNELKPNLQDLQEDVIDLLKEVGQFMARANNALTSENPDQKYARFQQGVQEATQNAENLELRMAIVAPMKAGKSTIINAIIGQDLLPSRNAAMTTLPTEIFFNAGLSEPILTLDDEVLSIFKQTINSLQQKINELGLEEIQERIAQYPHLNDLVRDIQSFGSLLLKPENQGQEKIHKFQGREKIHKILSVLNDIIRLCSVLDPASDPLFKLRDVPRIETPFWRSQEGKQSDKLGNLVIVDTPGPNEAGENLRLSAVVAEQLEKSSIVLIVLDFTQLNNQAAEGVKKQVKPIIEILGKENLYVLVNKVDQRQEEQGDMTPEEVKKFIASDLSFSESSQTRQVFEIAARRAFSATKFLLELQQKPDAELTEFVTAKSLAREVFGMDWEKDLENTTTEELEGKAQRLWNKSGFAPFLEQAINVLMESAAPRSMNSSLNLTHYCLLELRDDVKLRSSAIAQDEEQLRLGVGALETDLQSLEECRNRLKDVDSIRTSLESKLNQILEQLKKEAKVSIEDYFIEEEYKQGNVGKKIGIQISKSLSNNLSGFDLFPKWLSQTIRSQIKYKPEGTVEFETKREAEDFSEQAVAWARKRAEFLMSSVRKDAEEEVKQARTNFTNRLDKETKPIIEQAKKRLNEAFYIDLDLPSPTLESDQSLTTIQPDIITKGRWISGGYGEKKVKKRTWKHWLWIVPRVEDEIYKKPDVLENYYIVSINNLISQINSSLEAGIGKINQDISEYFKKDFKERFDTFFDNLDAYLGNYRDSLEQAQKDQQLSLEQKNNLIDELNLISQEAIKNLKNVELYMERNQQLMSSNK